MAFRSDYKPARVRLSKTRGRLNGAVKYGNIFSLDVGPDYNGKLRDIDVQTLRRVGEMIKSLNSSTHHVERNRMVIPQKFKFPFPIANE